MRRCRMRHAGMSELNVGSLPICGPDDRLHGIITDRDIVVKCLAKGKNPSTMTAGQLAQGKPITVDAHADAGEVLQTMEQHKIRRLPVIALDGSPESLAAAHWAANEAKRRGLTLRLLHAWPCWRRNRPESPRRSTRTTERSGSCTTLQSLIHSLQVPGVPPAPRDPLVRTAADGGARGPLARPGCRAAGLRRMAGEGAADRHLRLAREDAADANVDGAATATGHRAAMERCSSAMSPCG
ncbi:CBS domain-containing protein [Streptomyces sp. NPDC002577]